MIKIAILGSGQMGTSLCGVLGKNINYETWVYSIDQSTADSINEKRFNDKHLSNYKINAKATCDIEEAIKNSEIIFLTVPSFAVLSIAHEIALSNSTADIVLCSKGFNEILHNMDELLFSTCVKKILPNNNIFIFSGPSFASGIIHGVSTAISLATENIDNTGKILDCFSHSNITLYPTTDIIGVQISAAIKGAIAIKIGILESIQNNLSAAEDVYKGIYTNKIYKTLSEMIMEMQQIIVAMGGQDSTIISPAGIGDTIMVCNSEQSRNKCFGTKIGDILWQKILEVENGDLNKAKINFLNGDIETDLLTMPEIEHALSLAGGMVEGYFAIPKIAKILKNISVTTPHFDWLCDLLK